MRKETAKKRGGAKQRAEADALEEYRAKRDPGSTTEPFGAERTASGGGETRQGLFVVHLHAASRNHYDLRLQMGSALLSFAVPKGPSLDPKDKRLAVKTEEHPLEYLDFEDVIPDGNYGAGPMIVWDVGRVRYLESSAEVGLASGKLDFWLEGHKLRGRFALVETGKRSGQAPNTWLLLKKPDAHASERDVIGEEPYSVFSGLSIDQLARREEVAAELEELARARGARRGRVDASKLSPMLCALSGVGLSHPDFVYELKLDGVRIVADRSGEDVVLRYRKLRTATQAYPEVARAVRALPVTRLVLDGEIVAFDADGKPNFERLARRIHVTRALDVQRLQSEVPVVFVVFDVLQLGAYDLRKVPLVERKAILKRLLPGRGQLRSLDHLEANGQPLFDLCRAEGLEGVVAKRRSSIYRAGPKRYDDWVKIKCERDEDFVVVGWERKKLSRNLGALMLATYDGDELVFRGKAGTGFDDQEQDALLQKLRPLERSEGGQYFRGKLDREPTERHFVEPTLVANVRFLGWADSGVIRFPVYRGLRPDLEPTDCTAAPPDERLERGSMLPPESLPPGALEAEAKLPPEAQQELAPASVASPARPRMPTRVALTNQDKVFWPEGYTKGDLCEYYAQAADVMLPFLRGRPIMLVRYPDGIEGKNFYQWRVPRGTPTWLRTLQLRREELDGKEVTTFLVDSADALVHLANLGCIPLHILACREGSIDRCDFLTLDFDIGEQPFRHAITLARSLKGLLDELGFVGFPKTSGQSGLHVLIPLGVGVGFETARILVELLGRLVLLRNPELASMERRVEKRGAKVYIDTGQTGRGRTIVAPYSVRAYAGATVSTPLSWDEVHLALDPRRFTMFTVPGRISEIDDPLQSFDAVRPDVARAVSQLEKMMSAVSGA